MNVIRRAISTFVLISTLIVFSGATEIVAQVPRMSQPGNGGGQSEEDSGDLESNSAGFGGSPILSRQLFYNNSSFDLVDDVDAIVPDKSALFEGQTATFANYTSFVHGINGIMIDVQGLVGTPSLADFEFKVGTNDSPDQWNEAPAPSLEYVSGGGTGGSDRIKLIWADGVITKTWLQVRFLANSNTGFAADDVFYFGNAIAESGNDPSEAIVNLADIGLIRANQTGFGTADIDNPYDVNRDGRVRLDDLGIARANQSGFTPIKLITPRSGKAILAGLGQGVNFGNMLEAPNEGDWGLTVEALYFDKVVEAGLQHIRLPISWTHHAASDAPYTVDETFFERVDWCVAQANQRGLKIIVNDHHHEELDDNPALEWDRALAIWDQIATRYKDEPDSVLFEILNEPHGQFTSSPMLWNDYLFDALTVIRATNPTRKVLVGPVNFNSIGALASFVPPPDPDLIVSVHYYEPFEFTHQGAQWLDNPPPLGTTWEGSRIRFAGGWQSWSWGTTFESTNEGLEVTYDQGWAGLRFHGSSLASGATELHLVVDGETDLQIWFHDEADTESDSRARLQTAAGINSYVIDLTELGDSSEIRDVIVQNFSPDPAAQFTIKEMRMCGVNMVRELVETELESLRQSFRFAAKWSLDNNIPIHVGEFGAYSLADLPSRVLWTTAVREACEDYNIDWCYWEFGAGFGFYNPDDGTWRLPLLQALNPDFGQ